MNEELKIKIAKSIGSLDADRLIQKLQELNIGDDIKLYYGIISIPVVSVKDIEFFQQELKNLSSFDRAYPIIVIDDRIQIDTMTLKNPCKKQEVDPIPLRIYDYPITVINDYPIAVSDEPIQIVNGPALIPHETAPVDINALLSQSLFAIQPENQNSQIDLHLSKPTSLG